MTVEEAKKEIVAALRELRAILTRWPRQEYPNCLGEDHPGVQKLRDKIGRALAPHLATLDPEPKRFQRFILYDVLNVDELPIDPVRLSRLDHEIERFGGKAPSPVKPKKGATFHPKSGTLTLNGKVLKLLQGERDVLKRLTETGAASFGELQTQHGRPDKVLRSMLRKYSGLDKYISLPGGPGRGGYSTTIKLSDTD